MNSLAERTSNMTNELIKIDYTNSERPTVLARDLHDALEIQTAYKDWFPVCASTVSKKVKTIAQF